MRSEAVDAQYDMRASEVALTSLEHKAFLCQLTHCIMEAMLKRRCCIFVIFVASTRFGKNLR